jgi:phosphoglycolate phosphatase
MILTHNSSRFRAVLFDLDGTLVDSHQDIADSVNAVLGRLGLPEHANEVYKDFISGGVDSLVRDALPEEYRTQAIVNILLPKIGAEYAKRWNVKTRPFLGIPELLETLTNYGIRMAVLSNTPDEFAKLIVSKILTNWKFDIVVGARQGIPKKPDPTTALKIASELAIEPSECLYLGDSDVDMLTASASNMFPVGALWGYRSVEVLLAGGANELITHPSELLEFFRESCSASIGS